MADSETPLFDDELKQSNDRCVHAPHLAGFVDSVPECRTVDLFDGREARAEAARACIVAGPGDSFS